MSIWIVNKLAFSPQGFPIGHQRKIMKSMLVTMCSTHPSPGDTLGLDALNFKKGEVGVFTYLGCWGRLGWWSLFFICSVRHRKPFTGRFCKAFWGQSFLPNYTCNIFSLLKSPLFFHFLYPVVFSWLYNVLPNGFLKGCICKFIGKQNSQMCLSSSWRLPLASQED